MSAGSPSTGSPAPGLARRARPRLVGAHRRPGYAAALLHRLSGVALSLFLPLHFLTLGSALSGADRLESVLALTRNPAVRAGEWALVCALALHMALGLRVLAIEGLGYRERTGAVVGACVAAALAIGLIFLLNGA